MIDVDDTDADINPATNYIGAAAIMIPSTDDPRARPMSGRWRLKVGTYDPAVFNALVPMPGNIEHVYVTFKPKAEGSRISICSSTSPATNIKVANATSAPFVTDLMAQLHISLLDRRDHVRRGRLSRPDRGAQRRR